MKRTLSILLVFALLCPLGYSLEGSMPGRMRGKLNADLIADQLEDIGGLTFYSRYDVTIDAEFAKGSDTATFTRTGGATKPATYCDADGNIHKTITSHEPRYNKGYYDSSGFTATNELLLESAASTNMLQDSYFADATITDNWRASPVGGGTISRSTDKASPYATATVVGKVVTTGDDEGIATSIASKPTVADATAYTISCYLRGTGTVTIGFDPDAGTTGESAAITLQDAEWRRYSLTWTTDAAADGFFFVEQDGAGSATFYISGVQLEALAYPSSYIPTTAAALTRGAEALSYATLNNFVGGTDGTILLKYRPIMLPDEQGTANSRQFTCEINSNNKWQISLGNNGEDNLWWFTKSGGTSKIVKKATPFSSVRYSSHTVTGTFSTTADSAGNKINLYIDGVRVADDEVDYTTPVGSLPTTFVIQETAGQAMLLEAVVIYNKRLTATEAALIDTILE